MEKSHTPASIISARTVYTLTINDLKRACRDYLVELGEEVKPGREHIWGLENTRQFCFVVDEDDS